jgi:hypothetical protein
MNMTPYDKLKTTKNWVAVENAIKDLVNNGDLEEKTPREYIVGYIVQSISVKNQ